MSSTEKPGPILSQDRLKLLELLLKEKRGRQNGASQIVSVGGERKSFPASSAQRRFWLLNRFAPGQGGYTVDKAIRVKGPLQVRALEKAFTEIQRRHESLRTTFELRDDDLCQIIHAPGEIRLHVEDLSHMCRSEQEEKTRSAAEAETFTPFDLTTGPLLRVRLLRLADDEHIMLLAMHHIICDGWSIAILLNELGTLYEAFNSGRTSPLTELQVQYADFAVWQRQYLRGEEAKMQRAYWIRQLQGMPPFLSLPTDRARSSTRAQRGEIESIVLPANVSNATRLLCRKYEATLSMVLLSAFDLLLFRYTHQQDFAVGSPIANRRRSETEALIGVFINTLVFRARLASHLCVHELITQVRTTSLEAYANQDLPFEELVEDLNPERGLNEQPLFQVIFTLRNEPAASIKLPNLELTPLAHTNLSSPLDLDLSVHEFGDELSCWMLYDAGLFDRSSMQQMLRHFRNILASMVRDNDQPIGSLEFLEAEEQQQILYAFNQARAGFSEDKFVHQLFEEKAEQCPEAIAAVCEGKSITYGELDWNANRIGRNLRNLGVGPDARVGVGFEPGIEMLMALLGVLKSGGVYVPLDPGYPDERLRYMLQDSAPKILLVQSELRERFAAISASLPLHDLTGLTEQRAESETKLERDDIGLSLENLAYIIYTSGSSGAPKGVMIDHRAICSQIKAWQDRWQRDAQDRMLQFASINFDVSIEEIFCSLISGAVLVLRTEAWLSSAEEFFRLCEKEEISVVDLPTRFWQQLLVEEAPLPSTVRQVTIGGEAVERSSIASWFSQHGSSARLLNAYGPTETTINATVQELTSDPLTWRSIGPPIENVQIRILDTEGELTPIGVMGEMYIGGVQVARGYLNRADLTAERFVPDRYADEPGARVYRTGDLGRWLANGAIEFLGRNDQQVKIRGYRIEPGEIEAILLKHAQVKEVAVVAREVEGGETRLVAYYTARDQEFGASVQPEELRQFLGTKLPKYMVPWSYVRLDQLPLTVNGKLDVGALPLPELDPYTARHYEAPEGETETILAEIWAELLKVERVGRHDSFFELGGHSLLGVRMASRIQQRFGVAMTIGDLFARPVLADLAASLKSNALAARPPIKRVEKRERLPLSFAQQRLWFLATMEGASEAYHIPIGLRLKGGLNRIVLQQALDQIIRRHEVLRTRLIAVDGNPAQCIAPVSEGRFHMMEHDLQKHGNPKRELEYLARKEAQEAFDLEAGPLIRGRLIRHSPNEHTMLITVHHIIADEWSAGIFLNELSKLYQAFLRKEQDPLPELIVQYADYAFWERDWIEGEIGKQQAEYWTTTLKDAPALLELPTDHGRPSRQDYRGAFEGLVLSKELTFDLKALGRQHGTTLYMTVLAGWAALLTRLSGQQEVVVGTPVANREQAEIEGLIGFFVNTLALRVDLSGSPSVTELLRRVKNVVIGGQKNQNLPFEQVVGIVSSTRSLAHSPIFQTMVAWQKESEAKLALSGVEATVVESIPHRTAKFDLTLLIGEKGESASGGIEYATALFEPATIRRYAGHFSRLLECMVRDAARTVERLPLVSQEERDQVVFGWNQTAKDFPREKYVHELFEEQVEKTPDAVAVEYNEQRLTYRELNRRSNQIGHYLRKLGIEPDARIGICMERSPEMIVGLLAILKAGGAYVPLDPAYPAERLRFMVENSKPRVLLTQPHLRGMLDGQTMPVVELHDANLWNGEPETNLDRAWREFAPQRLVYVIYTSGSTGRPKGVAGPAAAAVNLLCWQINQSRAVSSNPQRTLQFAALGFDVSFQETFSTLCSGGTLVVMDEAKRHNATALAQFVIDQQIQRIFIPYVGLQILIEGLADLEGLFDHEGKHLDSKLQEVIVGGEQLHIESRTREIFGRLNGCVIQNHYGPTETHVVTSYCLGPRSEAWLGMPPIGRPISNAQVYILDKYWEPVPIGVIGELYLGGTGVSRGYLNRPEMTAERFLADPFAEKPGARMYKTGDRGRWLADGMIEFAGRNDDQVKIRGYRIEPGEIEAQLAEHTGVWEAAVVVREDVPGEKRLVAYYTTGGRGDAKKAIPREVLRSHLVSRLPEHMVPAEYVYMEQMPLGANGKLNRKALPAPERDASASAGYESPEGETEMALAEIWSDLLHVKQIGRRDNFFTLGGHSLLAVRLVSRVQKKLGLTITVADLFSQPVLADLAHSLKGAVQTQLPAIARAVREGSVPLSFAQQRLWFLATMEGSSEAYHIPFGLRLIGELNRAVLRRALDRVVVRHEALRTTFVALEGVPAQKIASSEESRFHLVEHDLRQHPDAGVELERLMKEEAKAPFDLEVGPLIRGRLVRESNNEYALLITMHHIVSDGWSIAVFCNEVVQLYEAFLHGKGDSFPELPVQYADYAVWQRQWMTEEENHRQDEYWKTVLQDAPTLLELPADRPRPAQQDYRGAFEELVLDDELTYCLKDLSRRHGTTLYMTLLAGWAVLLQRLSGQRDVVVGTPTANRGRAEIEALIGFFVNTLALRLNVLATLKVRDLLAHVKNQVLDAQQHQDVPFEHVVDIVRPVRSLAHTPIFQAMFSWLNAPEARPEFAGLTTKPLNSVPHYTAKFDLMLSLKPAGEGIVGGLEYATALFQESTIRRFKGYLCRLLEAMVVDDDQPVDSLAMLSDLERRQVLYEWNEHEVQVLQEALHSLFEKQAYSRPEAVAAEYGGQWLSYGELELRANQTAHYLREMGVRPEVRVGLCVPRSLEMLIGMLGILKAGGVYVPLDPSYPVERLQYMVEDSQAMLVVSTRSVKSSWGVRVVRLDDEWDEIAQRSSESLSAGIDGENLAYVIYTSGSTGRPKGAGIRHSSAVTLIEWAKEEYNAEEISVVLAATSLCFDLSVFEIFVPLSLGGKVRIVESALDLAGLATKDGVTLVNTVPSAMAELVQRPLPKSLRVVNLAGEALAATLVKQVYNQLENVRVMNLYGPTEDTTYSTYEWVTREEAKKGKVSIGCPVANTQAYVLDAEYQPVGIGVVGELYLGGAGLARGYVNRPDLTAEKFVPNPYGNSGGERLYRTGDLVRWTESSKLEFLGRADHQVKIRGYRIELGEIEAVFLQHEKVNEAVVVVREDPPGNQHLVAYYTGRAGLEGDTGAAPDELRHYLQERLPGYAVPAFYVPMEKLPLTPNGKVDRKQLPAPQTELGRGARSYVAPRTSMESLVAQIWEEILGVERAGVKDDFFALGGHSLSAMRLSALIELRSGKKFPLTELFRNPTIEYLAAFLESKKEDAVPSCLVPIRATGSEAPLFLVHPVGGTVYCYQRLARLVNKDRPIYAFQALAFAGRPQSEIPEMAHTYIKEMIAVQPNGPYFLGGWSMGGVVAFEMALQLANQNLPVALLALFDSYPNTVDGSADFDDPSDAFFNFARDLGVSTRELIALRKTAGTLTEKQILRSLIELAKENGALPADLDDTEAARMFEVFKINSRALRKYVPRECYHGPTLLLKAESATGTDLADVWGAFCSRIESHTVPGDHFAMFKDPVIQILARRLDFNLDRIDAASAVCTQGAQ